MYRSQHSPKLAIIRTSGRPVRSEYYNVQEIGLAKAIVAQGWQCDVFMASPTGRYYVEELQPGLRVFNLPYRVFLGDQGVFPGLLPALRAGSYDVIQVQEHWQFTTVLLAKEFGRRGIPVVLGQGKYQDNSGIRRLQNIVADRLAVPVLRRNLRAILCKTQAAARYLQNKGLSKTTVLPIGLDTQRFGVPSTAAKSDPTRRLRLIYVGYLRKPRRVSFLIELVDYLLAKDQSVSLTVVGDGPDLESCRFLASQNPKLNSRITFTGSLPQESLSAHYADAHLFLLPTEAEIYGMVVLESMYFGVPVLATRTAGPTDIITNGEDGYLLDGFDLLVWANVIQGCIRDPHRYAGLSQQAAETVRRRFTWEALGPKYAEYYNSLLSTHAFEEG